ncbi:hypothetical protein RvY_12698-2 [Ramazzottius varieornatus]|uniref:TrmE-type G domain-containing protein n=1 Tax=Ramazzottius varieornatus TaxID=947166 RepID=A0A1D1VMD6_RAMVA|nr:hypothetical protein RvY_12698-2 [Ramazzottius varieornatus]
MPGPHTFTGEDLAELHIHGGQAVINAVLYAIGRVPKTRLAEPGEFTRRQMDGDLRRKFSDFRERLMTARAHLEAFIDFSEEEHLEPDILNKVKRAVKSVQVDLKECLTDNRRGERLRNGVHVTIVGEPNVGKSSLLNAICQKPTAIVSPIAGTTRDVVESAFDLGGYPVLLSDTAGLRETEDVIESEGVRRAVSRAVSSDLIVLVLDADQFTHVAPSSLDNPDSFIRSRLASFGIQPVENQRVTLLVNKIDLVPDEVAQQWRTSLPKEFIFLSCTTNTGMRECIGKLTGMVEELCGNPLVGEASLTQHRHRSNLEACAERLGRFQELLDSAEDVTLATHEIQQALRFLGKVTGHVYVEEVLDVIFRDFCIGK